MLSIALTASLAICASDGPKADEDLTRVVVEGDVAAPAEEVWTAFVTKEGMESWNVAYAEVDLQIGGTLRTHYDPKGKLGDAKTIEQTILAYDPGRMLAIRVSKAPEGFLHPEVFAKVWTVVYIDPAGASKPRVRVATQGFGTDEASQAVRKHFVWGNDVTLKKLQKRFTPPATGARK